MSSSSKTKALEMLVSSTPKAFPVELNGLWVFAIQDEVRWCRVTFYLRTVYFKDLEGIVAGESLKGVLSGLHALQRDRLAEELDPVDEQLPRPVDLAALENAHGHEPPAHFSCNIRRVFCFNGSEKAEVQREKRVAEACGGKRGRWASQIPERRRKLRMRRRGALCVGSVMSKGSP
ncbi:MAG: hypothetical protein LBU32_26975 [Clostridiales bacterium]|nr:hypothetical protein [Clostridiales bacterium]